METLNIDQDDDLVLHEGDGKIRRPSKLTTTKNEIKLKKMPSPRKIIVSTTSTSKKKTSGTTTTATTTKHPKPALKGAAAAATAVESASALKPSSAAPKIDDNNNKNNNKSGMEEFFDKVRRKSNNLVAPNVYFEGESDDDIDDDDDSLFQDWDDDDRKRRTKRPQQQQQQQQQQQHQQQSQSFGHLTTEDIEICQRLDDEYERALEERDIGYNARYSSVRQTAMWSVCFLVFYMVQGTYCYRELLLLNNRRNHVQGLEEGESDEFDNEFSNWSIPESLFFSIFTITTVGYGREDLPTTQSFQAYTIVYILIGIAALTIMVAQVYQCIALEASRARLSQDKQTKLKRRTSGLMLSSHSTSNIPPAISISSPNSSQHNSNSSDRKADPGNSDEIIISDHAHTGFLPKTVEWFFRSLDKAKHFFRETEIGKGISVVFPFCALILSGACVVCPLEGWTFLESLYFAVVSLTTVGFGDYVPTKLASIWFCIFWLPFSIGFMSMYLSNIATFYIRLSDRNIRRIERQLRRRLQKAKENAEEERAEVLRRAYRGQETEIEIVAGADSEELRLPVQLQRSRSCPSSNAAWGGGSGSDSSIEEGLHSAAVAIPMNHARSVMRRRKQTAQDGFNILPTSDDDGANSDDETVLIGVASDNITAPGEAGPDTGYQRRQRIIESCRVAVAPSDSNNSDNNNNDKSGNSNSNDDNNNNDNDNISQQSNNDRTMKSMKDVIRAVRNTLNSENYGIGAGHTPGDPTAANSSSSSNNNNNNASKKFMSIQSTQIMIDYSMFRRRHSKKPSFALRVLVQERFAEIIAIEVAGYHSPIEIKDHTMSVTIHSMSETADKWFIPRRARKAFRVVAFDILYFVGEHGLITRGADALYELTPFEFHGLFSTLVAAMGDADIMEGWLAKTDTLALVDLQKGVVLHRSAPEDYANDRSGGGGGARQRVFSID